MHWIYSCDDNSMPPDYGPKLMSVNITKALATFGVEMYIIERMPERLGDAGFVNVQTRVHKVPVGPWARDKTLRTIGSYNRGVLWDGLQAITMGTFTRGLKWTREEVETFLVKVRKDLMDPSVHSYVFFHSVWAQKPGDEL